MHCLIVAAALALGTAISAAPAHATTDIWYSCLDPGFASFGVTHIIIRASVAAQYQASYPNVRCGFLDIDYGSSVGRACYLQWRFPGRVYGLYTPA